MSDFDLNVVAAMRKRWAKLVVSTKPADFDKAVRGAVKAYKSCGYPPPTKLIKCSSPLEGAKAASILSETEGRVDLSVENRKLSRYLSPSARNELWTRMPIGMRNQASNNVWRLVEQEAQRRVRGRSRVWDRCMNHWQEHELLAYDYLERTGVATPYRGHLEIFYSAGWWWPFAFTVVICDRPRTIIRDGQGFLHNESGPAVAYPDGWSVYALHGVAVPERVVTHPESLTAWTANAERNAEVRRIMIERMGPGKYMKESGAELVATDDWGKLWRADPTLSGRRDRFMEPLVMVEVLNSTPEPDGSFKTYWLRVPPNMSTPHEAIAWTYQMSPDEYYPDAQT